MNKQQQLNAEQINAFREQQIVNTRILSLKQAMKIAIQNSAVQGPAAQEITVDKVIEDAKKLAAFYIEDLDGLKKKSGLVITGAMPPPAAGFRPGD